MRIVLIERRGWHEYDEEVHEEDAWMLHWRSGRFKPSSYTNALRHQRVNHFPKSSLITKKDFLLKSLRKFKRVYGSVYVLLCSWWAASLWFTRSA